MLYNNKNNAIDCKGLGSMKAKQGAHDLPTLSGSIRVGKERLGRT